MKTHNTVAGDFVRPCYPAIAGRPACLGTVHLVVTVWDDNYPHLRLRALDGETEQGGVPLHRHSFSWVNVPKEHGPRLARANHTARVRTGQYCCRFDLAAISTKGE